MLILFIYFDCSIPVFIKKFNIFDLCEIVSIEILQIKNIEIIQ